MIKAENVLRHLSIGFSIALTVVLIVGYFNPHMGFTSGTVFNILLISTVILIAAELICLVASKKHIS